MKKTIQILGSVFIASMILLTSCTKTDNSTLKNDVQSDWGKLSNISEELIFIETPLLTLSEIEYIESQLKDENNEIISDSDQLQLILTPLIENGNMIYYELLSKLQNTDEYFQLSNEDKNIINNLSDFQKAELSLLFSMASLNENNNNGGIMQLYSSNTGQVIFDCLGAALGLDSIMRIINGYKGLSAAEGLAILRKVGSRYLGYIGLAYAIVSFIDCIAHAEIK